MEERFKGDFSVTDSQLVLNVEDCPYPSEWTIYKIEGHTYFARTKETFDVTIEDGMRYISGSTHHSGIITQDGDMVKMDVDIICEE